MSKPIGQLHTVAKAINIEGNLPGMDLGINNPEYLQSGSLSWVCLNWVVGDYNKPFLHLLTEPEPIESNQVANVYLALIEYYLKNGRIIVNVGPTKPIKLCVYFHYSISTAGFQVADFSQHVTALISTLGLDPALYQFIYYEDSHLSYSKGNRPPIDAHIMFSFGNCLRIDPEIPLGSFVIPTLSVPVGFSDVKPNDCTLYVRSDSDVPCDLDLGYGPILRAVGAILQSKKSPKALHFYRGALLRIMTPVASRPGSNSTLATIPEMFGSTQTFTITNAQSPK